MSAGADVVEAAQDLEAELRQLGHDVDDSRMAAANLLEAVTDLIRAAKGGQPVLGLLLPLVLWLAEVVPDVVQGIHIRLPWDRSPEQLREAAREAASAGKDQRAHRLRRKARRRDR